jgi:hypothetical protein
MKYKKPSLRADIMKTYRQEFVWAKTAKSEDLDEAKRATLWKKRGYNIFASELEWDSGIAGWFHNMRLNRAKIYKKLAKKLKAGETK